jgi:hypothetical protein
MSEPKRIPVLLLKHHRSPGNGEFLSGMVAGFFEDEARDLIARGVAVPYAVTETVVESGQADSAPVAHEASPSVVEDGLEAFAITARAEGTVSPPPAEAAPVELSTPKKKKKA